MLIITDTAYPYNRHQWNIGEPFPKLAGRTIMFQADGDELNLLINCIRKVSSIKEIKK